MKGKSWEAQVLGRKLISLAFDTTDRLDLSTRGEKITVIKPLVFVLSL
jgi:hypothetical protein